jgi:hypothetical protein
VFYVPYEHYVVKIRALIRVDTIFQQALLVC